MDESFFFGMMALDDAFTQDNKLHCVARELQRQGGGFERARFRCACAKCGVAPEDFSAAELRRLKKIL